jgi:hypothetical protein
VCTHFTNNQFVATASLSFVPLQKNLLEDGVHLFHQPDIRISFECSLLFLRSIFEHRCNNQPLEMRPASKETMLFHDNGFILLRRVRFVDKQFDFGCYFVVMVNWTVGYKLYMAACCFEGDKHFPCFFLVRFVGDEF